MAHDDPARAWDRHDRFEEELAERAYEAQRDQLVADAAAGDPGEAEEAQYLLPRDAAPMSIPEFNRIAAIGAEQIALDDAQGPDEPEDDNDDESESTTILNDRVYAFLEDVRDYLRAKPACDGDPEAEELIELAEELMERFV